MSMTLRVVVLASGSVFAGFTLYLLAKRRFNERNSLFWLFGSSLILLLACIPQILDGAALIVGVDYPPTLLFLISILITLAIVLHQAVQISILEARVRELVQQTAVAEQLRAEGVIALERTTYHRKTPRSDQNIALKEKPHANPVRQTGRFLTH